VAVVFKKHRFFEKLLIFKIIRLMKEDLEMKPKRCSGLNCFDSKEVMFSKDSILKSFVQKLKTV